jgi:hypothetical protein
VSAEATIRHLRPSDHAPVIAVIDEWWGGRVMARMLPRLFFDHFTDTSFAADRDDTLAGFLVGFVSQSRPGDGEQDLQRDDVAAGFGFVLSLTRGLRLESDLKVGTYLPLIYHVGDQPFTYSVFLCGGTLVLGRRPDPAHIAEMISEEKVTALWCRARSWPPRCSTRTAVTWRASPAWRARPCTGPRP